MDSPLGSRTFPVWLDELLKPSVKQEYDAALSGNRSREENDQRDQRFVCGLLVCCNDTLSPNSQSQSPLLYLLQAEKSHYMIHTRTVLYGIHVHLHVSCRGKMVVKDKRKRCHG